VGGIVPDEFERTRIVAGDNLDFRVGADRIGEIGQPPSSAIATAFLASDFDMPSATSRPVTPAGNSRTELSGKVRWIIIFSGSLPLTIAGKRGLAAA
jgi:hypothetical protein